MADVAAKNRQRLSTQEFSHDRPGPIVGDIQTMIDTIGIAGLPTQSTHGNLPQAALADLNARLSQPIEVALKRPSMRDYPNIGGLFVLLRVMDLAQVNERRVWINEPALALWSSLNPAEKYFALLEAWLLHASGEIIGPREEWRLSQFTSNLLFLAGQVSSRWKPFDEMCHQYEFLGGVSAWNAQLQVRFGLIEVQPRPVAGRTYEGRGWIMEKARRTPWGEAVACAILAFLKPKKEADVLYYSPPEDATYGFLQPAFQPYIPAWQKVFAPPKPASRSGLYILKVSLARRYGRGSAWRRLAVPDKLTLDDLAYVVLQAFEFEEIDHLYEFRFKDRFGRNRVYNHPFTEEPPFTNVKLRDLGLPEKQVLNFLFDFGESWPFELRLERIEPADKKVKEPTLIESHGKAPEQYPDLEEW